LLKPFGRFASKIHVDAPQIESEPDQSIRALCNMDSEVGLPTATITARADTRHLFNRRTMPACGIAEERFLLPAVKLHASFLAALLGAIVGLRDGMRNSCPV